MATKNPFDLSNLFAGFDPQALTRQMQEAFAGKSIPGINPQVLAENQRKNMELLMSTNQAMLAGSQALVQRQAAMLQETIAELTEAAGKLADSGDPQQVSEKQVELLQQAFDKALKNSNEISSMIKETQESISDQVNKRISESLQELKETIAKVK
ncbi:MAG: phasin family protein [Sedimenticola sp.]|nr:phasin family protein [Sedimenticola sp.]